MTETEKLLCNRLNYKQISGFKFRRQHPINQFIVDFYCHKAKLVIEIDGKIDEQKAVAERDEGRENILNRFGIEILRFTNQEILTDLEKVTSQIGHELMRRSPSKPL